MQEFSLTREMSITHADFFRLLPKAIANAPFSTQQNEINIETNEGRVTISLAAESFRKIASIRLPVTKITMKFNGVTEDKRAKFLARFDLAYQRGGG